MSNKKYAVAGAVLLLALATGAHGQATALIRPAYVFPPAPEVGGPGSIQIGDTPAFVTPYLGVAGGRDDNLLLSNTNQRASNYYVVSPSATLDARDSNKVLKIGYYAQIGRYSSSTEDDYVDQAARAQFDMAFDPHNFL